jgi:hypothetical protein
LHGEIFIDAKRIELEGKSIAQLEHLLQQANDSLRRAERSVKNYPPLRMERYGKPYLEGIRQTINIIAIRLEAQCNISSPKPSTKSSDTSET